MNSDPNSSRHSAKSKACQVYSAPMGYALSRTPCRMRCVHEISNTVRARGRPRGGACDGAHVVAPAVAPAMAPTVVHTVIACATVSRAVREAPHSVVR